MATVVQLQWVEYPLSGGNPAHRRPVIPVAIQHPDAAAAVREKHCLALVDTGATGLRIGSEIARELGLPTTGEETTWRSGVLAPTPLVAAKLIIPKTTVWEGSFPQDDLRECGIDAILGMNVLRNFVLQINGPRLRGSLTWLGR
jgi:hypothetical protein